jgi:hypothetical protein
MRENDEIGQLLNNFS